MIVHYKSINDFFFLLYSYLRLFQILVLSEINPVFHKVILYAPFICRVGGFEKECKTQGCTLKRGIFQGWKVGIEFPRWKNTDLLKKFLLLKTFQRNSSESKTFVRALFIFLSFNKRNNSSLSEVVPNMVFNSNLLSILNSDEDIGEIQPNKPDSTPWVFLPSPLSLNTTSKHTDFTLFTHSFLLLFLQIHHLSLTVSHLHLLK